MNNSSQRKFPSKWKSLTGVLAFVVLFGGKLKYLLPLLKLGKFGGTIWSMALMIGAYAIIYPWFFAVGIAVMIFIHEMGHILAAKRRGIPVSAPAFIPFLGALITLKKQPQDAETEAYLALGGPVIGTIGALIALVIGVYLQSPAWLSVAQVGFFLNLINLIPIHPLDGGRIVTAISRWLWVIGLVGGLVIIIYFKAIIFFLIWLLFAWELYKKYIRKDSLKDAKREITRVITVPEKTFMDYNTMKPAEAHQRDLPFYHVCDVSKKTELCHIFYPGIGRIGVIAFDLGLVDRVRLISSHTKNERLEIKLTLEYYQYPEHQSTLLQKEEYYQVSSQTRWVYGLSYFGLAAFLIWMMTITYSMFTPPTLVG